MACLPSSARSTEPSPCRTPFTLECEWDPSDARISAACNVLRSNILHITPVCGRLYDPNRLAQPSIVVIAWTWRDARMKHPLRGRARQLDLCISIGGQSKVRSLIVVSSRCIKLRQAVERRYSCLGLTSPGGSCLRMSYDHLFSSQEGWNMLSEE